MNLRVLLLWAIYFLSPSYALRRSFVGSRSNQIKDLRCSPAEALLPCVCDLKVNKIHVRCENSEIGKVGESLELLKRQKLPVEELYLVSNRIPSIPPRFFGSLAVNKIFMIDNELVSISRNAFAGLESSLEHIYFHESILQDLPFDTFDNLQQLRSIVLESTSIKEIPRLYFLPSLEFLKVDQSHVMGMYPDAFDRMDSMKKIQISNSNMKSLDENVLKGLLFVKEINFSNNNITWIHPGAFRRLELVEELNLSGNIIEDAASVAIPARELRSLKSINLSGNQIKLFRQVTFVDMRNLEEVDLSNNQIQSIESEAMYKLPKLKILDLSKNHINNLQENVFVNVDNLEFLNLAENNLSLTLNIKDIYRSLPNLLKLDLSGNYLKGGEDRADLSFGDHSKLQTLILSYNFIDTLSKDMFRGLPYLVELYLDHNLINHEAENQIWHLPELLLLDISHNDLKKLEASHLKGLPLLNDLKLSFNLIEEISPKAFENSPFLKVLNVSYNKLTKLLPKTFENIHDLYELDISYNILTVLETGLLEGLTSLEFLHASHNQFMTVHGSVFKDTVKLKSLDLSHNLLNNIPTNALQKLSSLTNLNFKNNAIRSIAGRAFDQLRVIEYLDLSRNHIQTVNNAAFNEMNVLRDLDLSVNYIQNFGAQTFSQMKLIEKLNISNNFISSMNKNTFENVKRLRILDLTNNSLTSLNNVQDLPSLQGLFLNHNYINKLFNSTFINLPSLNVLFFSNNGLQTFEIGTFYNLSSLMFLDLRNNNLVELKSYSFPSLNNIKELKLSQNQISLIEDYAFMNLASLQSIELEDNIITHIGDNAFDMLPSLKFLNLSKNGLQAVPEKSLSKITPLDVLDLSWNYIMKIEDTSFKNLQWLTVLLLDHNELCHLSTHAFQGPRSLRVLMLHNNQMKRLHLSALREPIQSLSLLDMSGNPFVCDCELVWLREYLQTEGEKRVDQLHSVQHHFPGNTKFGTTTGRGLLPNFPSPMHGEPVCAGPHQYAGKPITEVPPEAFLCNSLRNLESKADKCAPRRMDPGVFSAGDNGLGLSPEVLNKLLKLSNLPEIAQGDIEKQSYLDYKNPIFVSGLTRIQNLAKDEIAKVNVAELTKLSTATTTVGNQPPAGAVSGFGGTSNDFVTGDTPTFYAGPSPEKSENDDSKSSGGIFGFKLPTLPTILGSLGKLKVPNFGLNMVLPFGRVGGNLSPLMPNRASDNRQSNWAERGHFDRSSPQAGSHRKFGDVVINENKRHPYNSNGSAPFDHLMKNNKLPTGASDRKTNLELSRPINTGPGPNSGTPFLPGLVSPYDFTSMRPFSEQNSGHPQSEHHRNWDRLRDKLIQENVRGIVRDRPSSKPSKHDYWDWSPPDVIHPSSGVSGYPPTSSFRPMNPNNHRNPIVVINGPNSIAGTPVENVAHHPLRNLSNKVSTTTANILSLQEDYRSSLGITDRLSQPGGNIRSSPKKGIGSVFNVDLKVDNKIGQNSKEKLKGIGSVYDVNDSEIEMLMNQSPLTTTKSPLMTTNRYDAWTKSFILEHGDTSSSLPELNIDVSYGTGEKNNLPFVPMSISLEDRGNQPFLADILNQTIHILQDVNATESFSKSDFQTERLPSNWFISSSSSEEELPDMNAMEDTTAQSGSRWPSIALGDGVSLVHTNKNLFTPQDNINPLDREGLNLAGAKHVSPSRSIGRFGGRFLNVNKVDPSASAVSIGNPTVLGVDLPPQYDEPQESPTIDVVTEIFPEVKTKQAGTMDWYYSNYHREYDREKPSPVGGNGPPPQYSSLCRNFHTEMSITVTTLIILLNLF